ncbi:hypothetical protein LUR56_05605 [Streptomyces sp. MT29]|nr:hypothetical protein [Streptomyces sp. MT29]
MALLICAASCAVPVLAVKTAASVLGASADSGGGEELGGEAAGIPGPDAGHVPRVRSGW